jgi:uncharacterized OB-fold protein
MQLPKHWRLKSQRYRMAAVRDPQSGTIHFPPPEYAEGWDEVALSGQGVIETFAAVGNAPEGFADGAVVALVRLAEGPVVTAQLTDVAYEDLAIGQRVEMVTRKLRDLGPDGLIVYAYKFRPLLAD